MRPVYLQSYTVKYFEVTVFLLRVSNKFWPLSLGNIWKICSAFTEDWNLINLRMEDETENILLIKNNNGTKNICKEWIIIYYMIW